MSDILDLTAPSIQDGYPKRPEELPHGFLAIPPLVRELVAQDEAKHPTHKYPEEFREHLLNMWTLQFYFDYHGHEVAYRQTPEGPEVLAVGFEERIELNRRIGDEAYMNLKIYNP